MPSPLEKLPTVLPRTSGLSAQTNRALIEHGEHATIQKLPPVVPVPDNTKGKSSAEVMAGFRGETVEQFKARQTAQNKLLLERHMQGVGK